MSNDRVFGAPTRQLDVNALKLALHRYIIDKLNDEDENFLESPRNLLSNFVNEHVQQYIRSRQIAVSRYEADQVTEELVDELVGYGPLEVLLRDPSISEILVNGPDRVFV